jgi:hypothetical protein
LNKLVEKQWNLEKEMSKFFYLLIIKAKKLEEIAAR